ncbi:MAG: Hsp70 family protein [Chitinophagaceae bacterium]|nr:Hsp70 family protein [Oligoflexus sp.]
MTTNITTNIIGIDLGTSHSSLAVSNGEQTSLVAIPQLSGAHETVTDALFPSAYFHNQEYQNLSLPWDQNPPLLGRWARDLALTNPERAILSAKSWLCYKGDLRLPPRAEWQGLTAKEVSTLFLSHLMKAFEYQTGAGPEHITKVAITVPASFDPMARQLTEEAAIAAGIKEPLLIEEPLAAFYAWLAHNPDWNKQLKTGDSVLVCDVGGGTSDFSLIVVSEEPDSGELRLDRIAVGRHLLLGGDNMDLALAHSLQAKQGELDHWQFISLQQQVRKAKEFLLSPGDEPTYPISITGRGSSLFAQTLRLDVSREDIAELIVNGFFPHVDALASPRRSSGLQTIGLPYEHDPAITKHLACFLRQASVNTQGEGKIFKPSHILFNGGVFKAPILQKRVIECVKEWNESNLTVLKNPDLDHAVTLGAAHYAALKVSGQKLRVRTAASRSYYIGLESNQLAIPGIKPKVQGLCVLPQGAEEGSAFELSQQEFALWGGEHVSFQLFASEARADLGTLISDAEKDLEAVSSLACQIDDNGQGPIPVFLQTDYDETGKLRIAMRESSGPRHWDLNFQLREDSDIKK